MDISIVIPAYNEERYLSKTLSSIARLHRQPDEVIVVDNSSTDATARIAQQFGAKVIRVPRKNVGLARQRGLEAATGDIVASTDADTIVPPLWLTTIEEALTKPGIVATFGHYVVADGKLPYRLWVNYCMPVLFWLMAPWGLYLPGGQNIAFWRKKALAVGGFPIDFQGGEDYEIMHRLSTTGKIIYRVDNIVVSSGRRGNEGFTFIPRVVKGHLRYFFTGKADSFSFPDIR